MLSNSELYRIWRKRLSQLMPETKYRRYRLANMLIVVVGMYKARSVHLNIIARKIPIRAKKLSLVRRLRRFIANTAVRVREWYQPVARQLLAAAASAGQVHLVIDSTKVSAGHRLVMVGIAYRRRTLPLAWTWVRSSRGHSTTNKQVALMRYVYTLIPKGVAVSVVGDSEFGGTVLMRQLDEWGWDYALRQRGRLRFMPYRSTHSYRFDQVAIKPGEMIWMGRVDLTVTQAYVTNVVIYWAPNEKEPWFLATNLPCPHHAIRLYRRRMWIEEMFGDMKGHGFDLEVTRFHHIQRLSRITLIVCLVYLWLIAIGEHVRIHHLAHDIDRSDRRDLSIFRTGWDFLERRLLFNDPIPIVFVPAFAKVSGS
jgi:hypothetical protein